ncbi:MAG: NAD-dependent epimerase/dehydratase family protein [Chloroflexi bacterium]|nr:NAD-dependent epimerase/dehydratase family protein [Chloroflexota bacterium]
MSDPARRVAVTGAAGYVGSSLIKRLEREEAVEKVLALDTRHPEKPFGPKVLFQKHDVTAPLADTLAEHTIDSMVHLAFVICPRGGSARRVNVAGTSNVLEACAQAGVGYLLYLSSTTVYGAHPDNPLQLTEESPIRPVKGFRYGEHKADAERLLRTFAERHSDVAVTVLRACPVMGPNADNFISRAFSKPFLVAVRGYDPPVQLLHEDDLAYIMATCLLQRASGVYNVAGDGALPWSEMASLFGRKLLALPAPGLYGLTALTWALRLQSDSPACGLDFIRYPWTACTGKIERELGLRPRHSARDALMAFVDAQRRA